MRLGGKVGKVGWRWSLAGVNGPGARASSWRQGQPLHGAHMHPVLLSADCGAVGPFDGGCDSVCVTR